MHMTVTLEATGGGGAQSPKRPPRIRHCIQVFLYRYRYSYTYIGSGIQGYNKYWYNGTTVYLKSYVYM